MKKKWEEMIEAVVSEVRKIYSKSNGKNERIMPVKRTVRRAQKAKRVSAIGKKAVKKKVSRRKVA
jgi:malic enzyme